MLELPVNSRLACAPAAELAVVVLAGIALAEEVVVVIPLGGIVFRFRRTLLDVSGKSVRVEVLKDEVDAAFVRTGLVVQPVLRIGEMALCSGQILRIVRRRQRCRPDVGEIHPDLHGALALGVRVKRVLYAFADDRLQRRVLREELARDGRTLHSSGRNRVEMPARHLFGGTYFRHCRKKLLGVVLIALHKLYHFPALGGAGIFGNLSAFRAARQMRGGGAAVPREVGGGELAR